MIKTNDVVQQIIRRTGLQGVVVTAVEQLKTKQGVGVSRVFVDGYSRQSIIVKHMDWQRLLHQPTDEIPIQLQYESCHYQFLQHIRTDFYNAPQLLCAAPGVLIIEDLGEDDYVFAVEAQAHKMLLNSFVQLHAASYGKKRQYQQLKVRSGLPKDNTGKLAISDRSLHFKVGSDWLLKHLSAPSEQITKELNEIQQVINQPDMFEAFLHHDFVSRRQSVVKDKIFYLLDFEQCEYGHCLQEMAIVYFGKIEYNLKKGLYFRKCSHFIAGSPQYYRQQYSQARQLTITDEQWQRHFGGVMLYHALSVLGNLLLMPDFIRRSGLNIKPQYAFDKDVADVVKLVGQLLSQNNDYPQLVDFLLSFPVGKAA
ncbi:MAG: hypothetical protein HRT35_34015 [Algicola sp.]|nr:hypothetical protein [Algicola sp.]